MSDAPSPPELSDEQKALLKRYKPSIWQFAVLYLLTCGVYVLTRSPLPEGTTKMTLLIIDTCGDAVALGVIAAYVHFVRELPWKPALAYAATVAAAFFCADLVKVLLLTP